MRNSLLSLTTALSLTAAMAMPVHSRDRSSLAWTRMGQAGAGLALGVAGAYLGATAGKAIDPCNEKQDEESAMDLCNSSGTTLGAVGGYLMGASVGVYGAGRLFGGEGSPWMAAGGVALGLVAGGLLSSQIDGSPVLQVMTLVAFSQGLALLGYHWSDQVRVTATLDTVPGKSRAGSSIKPKVSLRPQVELTLARF